MQKRILHSFFQKVHENAVTVKYWDDETREYGTGPSKLTIVFNRPLTASFDLKDPALGICEAYMDEFLDFQGDFDEALKIAKELKGTFDGQNFGLSKVAAGWINKIGTKEEQKENIQHHYDLGNDFFSLWLDETMSYSCAYFKRESDSLYEAQINKIDHILKKLQLKKGERLLDIGSGWGWMILRAAEKYGVKATGITLSEEQYRETKERIRQRGLTDLVDVKLMDYLDLDENVEQYDKIFSVGMFEHVGKDNLNQYIEKVEKLLVPGGLSLLHSIMGMKEDGINTWIIKYIFPGGYIPSLRETIHLLPDHDLHLIHAESLRMHYARTLDLWYANYLEHWDDVEEKYGRKFARMWELYLTGCAANFRVSGLDLYQILFSKGLNNDLPLTLEHIYEE